MEYLATQLKYSNWEGFYTLTYKQISEHGGAGLLESKYENSIFKAVTSILSGTPLCMTLYGRALLGGMEIQSHSKGILGEAREQVCLLYQN